MFESFVNSEEYQTDDVLHALWNWFESFVNSEEYQTKDNPTLAQIGFESFVNSEEYQTEISCYYIPFCLRALLIQKSIKLTGFL